MLAEPAFDWVIEDCVPGGRPPFGPRGVRFVEDVEPYEHMKLRLLNGGHTALSAVGRLAGLETVPEAVAHSVVRRFLGRFWDEAEPTLAIDPSVSAPYRTALLPRFGDPALPHRTAQIATDASLKVPRRLLGAIRDRLACGEPIDALVVAVAAFIRSCGGRDDAGQDFAVDDPAWRSWTETRGEAASAGSAPLACLAAAFVFGEDLPRDARFTVPLRRALDARSRQGVLATLAERFC